MGKPRKKPAMKSTKEAKKDQLENEVGQLADGVAWTQEDMDKLLDMYFSNRGMKAICAELRRSQSAVESKVWKICTDYRALRYKPNKREDRTGLQWNEREVEALKMMNGMEMNHIQRVLCRGYNGIQDKIKEISETRPTLFNLAGQKPVPNSATVRVEGDQLVAEGEVEKGDLVHLPTAVKLLPQNKLVEEQQEPQQGEGPDVWILVIRDMEQRRLVGIKKYGHPVRHDNGRDHLIDVYQELLDACVYIRAAIEERDRNAK